MTATHDTGIEAVAARLSTLHEARAIEELRRADRLAPGSDAIRGAGSLIPAVLLLKGLPGPAEASGGAVLSGADGDAANKALEALGYDPSASYRAISRPEPGIDPGPRAARVRAMAEALDAPLVIALDAEARDDLAAAFGLAALPFGQNVVSAGRRLVAVEGLEASLSAGRQKRRVWDQFRAASVRGPVY